MPYLCRWPGFRATGPVWAGPAENGTDTVEHNGWADERFGAVADVFAQNFSDFDELGAAVTVFSGGRKAVELWGGIADETTGRAVDGETLFPSFSVIKATTATALHIQAERGLIEYDKPIDEYWPEFAAHGKA